MHVEIAQRDALHFREEAFADVAHHPLGDPCHDPPFNALKDCTAQIGGQERNGGDGQGSERLAHGAKCGGHECFGGVQRRDCVHAPADEVGSCHAERGIHQDEAKDKTDASALAAEICPCPTQGVTEVPWLHGGSAHAGSRAEPRSAAGHARHRGQGGPLRTGGGCVLSIRHRPPPCRAGPRRCRGTPRSHAEDRGACRSRRPCRRRARAPSRPLPPRRCAA